jgi:hypothetical protein
MRRERQCRICERLYTKKLNHVKKYHTINAYTKFQAKHLNTELSMCHICKIAFDENPMTHVKVKHGGPALKELAKTLE